VKGRKELRERGEERWEKKGGKERKEGRRGEKERVK
jgi:hypothetical protein